MGIYVTETGFNKRTFTQLEAYYTKVLKSVFGDDADLNPAQAAGALLDYLSSTDAQTWDALQDTYTANDVRNAVGVSLDNNTGALINVLRQDATKAQVQNVVLFGDEGVVVPAGKRARNSTTIDVDRVTFELDADTTITQTACRGAWFSVDYDALNTYIITLDTDPKNIGNQASAEAVVDAYVALLEAEGPQVYNAEKVLVDGVYQLRVWFDATVNNPASNAFDVGALTNMVLEEFGSPGNFTALLEGYVGVGVGFISEIATGVSGWLRVYNTDAKVLNTGTGIELDPEYRLRLQLGVAASGFATEDAIRRVVLT
ncbi:MAG: baseplate J/gp47 family protein, partial [Deltaproteobacteria bacterium]|nr:baseplate J/gp47 family protein [Deltaproteobacteria bacterium]